MEMITNEIKNSEMPSEKFLNIKIESPENMNPAKADEIFNKIQDKYDAPRHIITRNESLENDRHQITGVEFKRCIITLPDGEKIEGVFPKFESPFEVKLPNELLQDTDRNQFKECNKQLDDALKNNSDLKSKFNPEQIDQIKDGINDGTAPDGYVWHHDAESGRMQLVDFETHSLTGHTGGRSIWGGGAENR